MNKNDFLISLKLAKGEVYHGWKHFSVFLACLILGVAVMASVNTFGSIVKDTLKDEAQSLLGGDIEARIRGVEATKEQKEFLTKYGKVSYVATMRSMLRFEGANNLVEIKAVDEKYPLIGSLEFNESISKEDVFKENGIAVDPILLAQMDLKIGDEVSIGSYSFLIRATLKQEPDRAVQIFTFGPRVMMSIESIRKTGLISTFSLVEHRYRIDTPDNVIADEEYEAKIEEELRTKFPDTSWRVATGTDGNRTLKRFLDQLLAFMTLSGLATFLIAGIGIASSVRAYLEKKSQTIAVLKVQGACSKTIMSTYIIVIGGLSVVGGVLGVIIASFVNSLLLPFLSNFLPSLEGQSSFYLPALFLALWYGLLISYLFSIPALFSAVDIRPSSLFRSKTTILRFSDSKKQRVIIAVISALLLFSVYLNSTDKVFIIGAVVIILLAFLLFGFSAQLVKKIAKKIKVRKPWLKMALGNMHRPGSTTTTVIFAIGISLTVLIALTLTEANFQYRIKQIMEERAPSLFLIDIQPDQKEGIEELLLEYADRESVMLFPMVRGRIVKIDGKPVEEVKISDDIDWAVRGDRGLSYGARPPANANIIKGKWWDEDYEGEPLLSVDDRFLEGMGVDIGDTMSVSILGDEVTAKIASARKIDYSTFQLNFAMMFSPGMIESFPHTSLATIHLDSTDEKEFELASRISNNFPNVTAVRTKEVVQLVQNIMSNIAVALRVTVSISLFAGILVLTSALNATLSQRMYDVAILKVLGAKQSDILKSCAAEWMFLALVTSFIAATIGTIGAYLINDRLRGSEFYLMPHVTVMTIIGCAAVILIIGYIGNRRLFSFRPSTLLRNE
jgi:putative ABC transport system permease protein